MNMRSNLVALALCAFGVLAFSSLNASARIICNNDGDCWHTHEDYAFPPGVHVEIHPDNWHWREGEHFVWKEHGGRGYWHGGHWDAF
jgi:hypothetical protein